MNFSNNPTDLIFGAVDELPSDGELKSSLEFLNSNFRYLLQELSALKAQDDRRVCSLAPFLARSMLEVAFTGLMGRIDPFRVLSIQRIQKGTGYDRTKPWKAAMRWQGDVIAEEPPSSHAWTEKMDPQSMARALLGFYCDELFWRPALKRLYDYDYTAYEGNWISELKSRPISGFCGMKRGSLSGTYSELSKVVHYESVVELVAPDRLTVVELVSRSLRDIAELAFVVSFMEHPVGKFDATSAAEKFSWFEELEVIS